MIYIACPEKFATGGTELLHQLGFKLKLLGIEVKMFYYNRTSLDPVADRFKKYIVDYVDEIEDNVNNIIIVPEVNVEELIKYKKIKKYIW